VGSKEKTPREIACQRQRPATCAVNAPAAIAPSPLERAGMTCD
jgi:hypothetical protein